MLVNSSDLQQALTIISLVPSRSGVSCSEFIRVRSCKRSSTLHLALASEVYGEVNIPATDSPQDWCFYVDRKLLTPFIEASELLNSDTPFTFKAVGEQLIIKCGLRSVKFAALEEIHGYSELQKPVGAELLLTDKQRLVLTLGSKYATRDPTAAKLNCVYLLKDKAVLASTKYAVFYAFDKSIPLSVPMPLQIMNLLSNVAVSRVMIGKNYVVVDTTFGTVCQALNEKAKAFPYKAVLKLVSKSESYPLQFTVTAAKLIGTVFRLHQYVSGTVNRDIVVEVVGRAKDKFITLLCRAPQGVFRERVTLKSALCSDVACSWLSESLLPLADVAPTLGNIQVCYGSETPYLLRIKGLRILLTTRKA